MPVDEPSPPEPDDEELGHRWSVPLGAIVIAVVGATGLAVATWTATDPPGRVFTAVAAVVLGGAALFGALARPRLRADPDGLVLRGVLGSTSWPWARIEAVRVARARRVGLPVAFVEIEARDAEGTEQLMLFGRLELGADPVDVAAALQEHRARAGRRRPGAA